MLHFEIEDLSQATIHDNFVCESVDSAVRLFYLFCAERLKDDSDQYVLYLLNDQGDELCVIASYDDFINRVYSLIRISGGI